MQHFDIREVSRSYPDRFRSAFIFMTQLEVCVYSLASALTAQASGGHSIELCGGRPEGGTTPSAGLIKCVRAQISLPIQVMIRPRGGDFLYSEAELEVMCADIDAVKGLGVDGVVLGVLMRDGTVDEERTRMLVERAQPLIVTFHRAFDVTADPYEALEAVIRAGAKRVLTSGQRQRAIDGVDLLRRLVKQAEGRIEIVAGSGVSGENASELIDSGVQALHMTGGTKQDGDMVYKKIEISMASSLPGEYERVETDASKLRSVLDMLHNYDLPLNSKRPFL